MSRLNPVRASTHCFYNQLQLTFRLVDISVFSGTCLAMSRWLFRFTDIVCCSVCFEQFNCLIETGLWIVVLIFDLAEFSYVIRKNKMRTFLH